MSLLRYCLTGLCTGAGMLLFGVLAAKLFRLPNTMKTYRVTFLSLPAAFLCLSCADLIVVYLGYYTTMPRALFVGCVAGGVTIGILALLLYRWRHATANNADKDGHSPSRVLKYKKYKAMVRRRMTQREPPLNM